MKKREFQGNASFVNCVLIDRISNTTQAVLPHMHEKDLELFYVCSGEGKYMVDNVYYSIQAGDIVICNAGVLHGEEPMLMQQIHSYSIALNGVQYEGLQPNRLLEEGQHPIVSCGQLAPQVEEMMRLLYLLSGDTRELGAVCGSIANSMLHLTEALLNRRSKERTVERRQTPSVLAHRVRQYLDEHHSEALTLNAVAKRLHVSEYYLAHVFKNEFGIPPMQYVMKRRIGEAQGLLMHGDVAIADIADQLGFSSTCHFNTMFKKYTGPPPGQYRQTFRSAEQRTIKSKIV